MKASSSLWRRLHLVYPLIPFGIEATLRVILNQGLCWHSFNAYTLALIIMFTSFFVMRSLYTSGGDAENDEQKSERHNQAKTFEGIIMASLALFIALILLETMMTNNIKIKEQFKSSLIALKVITYVLYPFFAYCTVRAQQSFKLNTSTL